MVPVLAYNDVGNALDWLSRALGFREVLRWIDPAGVVQVAEMDADGGAIFLEARRGQRSSHGCHYVLVLVDHVDERFRQAVEAGAQVIAQPEDKPWGLRQCMVEDLDGHRWELSEHLRDVAPEAWGATPV